MCDNVSLCGWVKNKNKKSPCCLEVPSPCVHKVSVSDSALQYFRKPERRGAGGGKVVKKDNYSICVMGEEDHMLLSLIMFETFQN